MARFRALRDGLIALAVGVALLTAHAAHALPNFSQQTGQPCTACHIGAYGPQLTPFGRAFKIGGYTQTGGQGWQSTFPVSLMFLSSYTNTQQGQSPPPAEHYGPNGNFAMDQISAFLGGRLTDYAGAFVQGTFNGITSTFKLDNTDLRLTTPLSVGDTELRIGLSVNNGPTVQDPYNSTFAWGYPYVASSLAPTPAAQPILAGALIGNSLGATVYGWYDRSLYFEAGLYNTYGPSVLRATGTTYGPGSTPNPAPYVRAAYEWDWAGQAAYIGGLFFNARISPATGSYSVDGTQGQDTFTDYAVDGGYQFLGDGTHTVAATAIFDHETQVLKGTTNAGGSSQKGNNLNQLRANIAYYYQQTYGATIAWQKTWGKQNPLLYAPAPLTGSANGKPNSNAFILEADWVPFGKADSWGFPWVNLKLGVQYTIYTQFNGGTSNYDGFGRNASGNNTLYVFAWLIF
jgi:hypothetical protein